MVNEEPVTDALQKRYLDLTIRDLNDVMLSAGVKSIGTSVSMLRELADKSQPVLDQIIGERKEAKQIRGELKRAIFNMRNSSAKSRPAVSSIAATKSALETVRELVLRRGLLNVSPSFSLARFELLNTWGYTDREMLDAEVALLMLDKAMDRSGVRGTYTIILDANRAGREFIKTYKGQMYSNPQYKPSLKSAATGIARWLWDQYEEKLGEYWSGGSGAQDRFVASFVRYIEGREIDNDTDARMKLALGDIGLRR